MVHIMQGDSYVAPFKFQSEGVDITPEMLTDLEVFISPVRKTLRDGSIEYDAENGLFCVSLSQRDTFLMKGTVEVSVRFKFTSGEVVGVKAEDWHVSPSRSKVVL